MEFTRWNDEFDAQLDPFVDLVKRAVSKGIITADGGSYLIDLNKIK